MNILNASIWLKTIVDAAPMLLTILFLIGFARLIVFVGTYDDRKPNYLAAKRKKLAWDMVRDTRFMDLG